MSVALVLLLAGIAGAWLGLRGRRVDRHPLCRRCGFDLVALPAGQTRCSECGADVSRPRALRIGHRERNAGVALAGAVTAAAAGVWLATFAFDDWQPRRHLPVWWLAREATGSSATSRRDALKELTSRASVRALSTKQADGLADAGLALQADAGRPWDPAWGDFIGAAQYSARLSPDRWERYLSQAMAFTFKARRQVRRGDPLPVVFHIGAARVGFRSLFSADVQYVLSSGELMLTGTGSQYRGRSPVLLSLTTGRTYGWNLRPDASRMADAPDGPRHVTLDVEATVFAGASPAGPPDARRRVRLEAGWELVPADAAVATAIPDRDPAVRRGIEQSLRVSECGYGVGGGDREMRVTLNAYCPPLPLAFDVFVRDPRPGGRQWPLGHASFPPGIGSGAATSAQATRFSPSRVDVVLRPSIDAAVRSVDLTAYWDGEVVIRDVPVDHPDDISRERP